MSSERKAARSSTRRSERELAFQVLYGLAFSPAKGSSDLARAFREAPSGKGDENDAGEQRQELQGYAWELVEGVSRHQEELDAALASFSQNWRLERIGKVEITLLRLALFELLHRPDIPRKVAINEAIELSKQFGDEGSRLFINGILDTAAKKLGG